MGIDAASLALPTEVLGGDNIGATRGEAMMLIRKGRRNEYLSDNIENNNACGENMGCGGQQ